MNFASNYPNPSITNTTTNDINKNNKDYFENREYIIVGGKINVTVDNDGNIL